MGYRWLSYGQAAKYEPDARRMGVSKVARSSGGFMREFERAGTVKAMKNRLVPGSATQSWGERRDAFIARHLVSYRKRKTVRRRYALLMWAYNPGD